MFAKDLMQPSLIEKLFDEAPKHYEEEHHRLFRDFKAALNRGEIRAAEPGASAKSGWRVNAWVKKGILLGFRMGAIADMSIDAAKQPFSTSPLTRSEVSRCRMECALCPEDQAFATGRSLAAA